MNEKVSFVMPSRNTLEFLKNAYNSIRKNIDNKHELILMDDNSDDGTWKWLQKINKKDENVTIFKNNKGERVGHTILYDKGVELATNNKIIICHTDMYYGPNFVQNLLKNHEQGKVVSGTRIEPPLHPPGPEKIIKDFGSSLEGFKESDLLSYIEKQQTNNKNKTTPGFFAPWLISKKDFNKIGGHDPLFRPQSREDSDICYRFKLAGYDLVQSRDSFVYHFTCRGSRYKDEVGSDSDEWQKSNYKSERNFIRKWGMLPQHDKNLVPIINNKYKIRLVLQCQDGMDSSTFQEILRVSEPRVSQLVINDQNRLYSEDVIKYKNEEQKITDYNMDKRILYNPEEVKGMDIEIFSTPQILSQNNGKFIQLIHKLLDNIDEEGQYEYDGNKILIRNLKRDYYKQNVISNKDNTKYLNENEN